MNRMCFLTLILCAGLTLFIAGCERSVNAKDDQSSDTGPRPAAVVPDLDANNFKVDRPERFPSVAAGEYIAAPELNVTGVVSPDVSRQVPVISLASGRVMELDAQLGDEVTKGQLLFRVRSTDIAGAFSDYRQAVANEQLTRIQLNRAQILYGDGAIPKSGLETAQNAEDDAKVTLQTAIEHLHILGSDPDHPTGIVAVYAPVSGVITDQQITSQAGIQALSSPNPMTISDMSHVWVMCDVYENNLPQVHLNEFTDIHLTAYPNRILKGRISNIGPILDPNLRTAKVRLVVENPGMLRLGMFVTATFHGLRPEKHASVPATAILHLHDRDWVFAPGENGYFRRVEVVSGNMLPGNMQEIVSGISPGTRVVSNALVLDNTVEQ
ncbi:MAG: efflux RND transporter periplasmic adaptor subunit [Bryobacteraceae bacterium]